MTDFTPCACLGPMHGEPHCHCAMVRLGLPQSQAHSEDQAELDRMTKYLMQDHVLHGAAKELK